MKLSKGCSTCGEFVEVRASETVQTADGFYLTHSCGSTLFWLRQGAEAYQLASKLVRKLRRTVYTPGTIHVELGGNITDVVTAPRSFLVFDNRGLEYKVTVELKRS